MNAYSILHNYGEPTYSRDFQLINSVLSYKQNGLETNRAKLQSLYNEYPALQVKKGVDQKYIEDRLHQVKDIANKYASMDISDPNFASSIASNISQVLDDKVKTAVLSTKRMQAEDAEWEEMKKSKPELYSQLNHQYAVSKSDRERYLLSKDVGDTYAGGADFIEHRDISKKFMDNLPKIQEALKAKWVQTGPKEGFFQSLSNMEAVDRNAMEGVLSNLMDDKDLQQIRINAWGTYDNLPEAEVEEKYNAYFQEKEDDVEEQINNANTLLATKTGAQAESLKALITTLEDKKQAISSNTYDKLKESLKDRAFSTAYTTLYKEEFMGGFLDAYSYGPRELSREIDEVSKANVEFAEKVEARKIDDEETRRHNMANEAIALEKLNGTNKSGTGAGAGGSNQKGIMHLSPINAEELETNILGSGLALAHKQEYEALKGVNSFLDTDITPGDYRELAVEMKDLAGKARRNETIVINGQKVNVSQHLPALLKLQTNVIDMSPDKKEIRKQLQRTVDQVSYKLMKVVSSGNSFDPGELPVFKWKIEGNDKTGYKKVPVSGKGNTYAWLLREAEKAGGVYKLRKDLRMTLQAYVSSHMIADPDVTSLGKAEKTELYRTMRDNMLKDMSFKEFSKIAGSAEEIQLGLTPEAKNTFYDGGSSLSYTYAATTPNSWFSTKMDSFFNGAIPKALEEDVAKLKKMYKEMPALTGDEKKAQYKEMKAIEARFARVGGFAANTQGGLGTDYFLSELEASDLDYNKKDADGNIKEINSSKGIADMVNDSLLKIKDSDANLKRTGDLISAGRISVTPESSQYQSLNEYAQSLGLVSSTYKGAIIISSQNDDGEKLKDEFKITTYKTKDGNVVIGGETTVKANELIQNTGLNINQVQRTPYSAKFGTSAAKINLGNGSIKGQDRDDSFWRDAASIAQDAVRLGRTAELEEVMNKYQNGEYSFKMEVLDEGQPYSMVMYDGKNIVYSRPLEQDDYTYEDIADAYKNHTSISGEFIKEYLIQKFESVTTNP